MFLWSLEYCLEIKITHATGLMVCYTNIHFNSYFILDDNYVVSIQHAGDLYYLAKSALKNRLTWYRCWHVYLSRPGPMMY